MFTGLVKEVGQVVAIRPNKEGKELVIKASKLIKDIGIDDSVAVNGACQTATRVDGQNFYVQAVHTTLEKTTLGNLKVGDPVNLELALTLNDRLGGHLVQGHVNDVAPIVSIDSKGDNYLLTVKVPSHLTKYVMKEGSITIDGISLTVADYDESSDHATMSIIPHTWHHTVLNYRSVGDQINLEVDVLAKYIERLIFKGTQKEQKAESKITMDWLQSQGF